MTKNVVIVFLFVWLAFTGYLLQEESALVGSLEDSIAVMKGDNKRLVEAHVNTLNSLEDSLKVKNELLLKTQENLALYYTLSEAGVKAESVDQIRELASIIEGMPLGSPFADGHIITDSFGVRDERWFGGNGVHEGIDLISKGDWTVLATADGMVTEFGENDIFGKYIVFTTDTGYTLKYAHLSTIYYQEGTSVLGVHVNKGERVGRMGNTGLTSGAHLHYEIHLPKIDGATLKVNPEEIINYIGG